MGQCHSDNINWMITLANSTEYIKSNSRSHQPNDNIISDYITMEATWWYRFQFDNINRTITLANSTEYINSNLRLFYIDRICWTITLSVITLSGFHCTYCRAHKTWLKVFKVVIFNSTEIDIMFNLILKMRD